MSNADWWAKKLGTQQPQVRPQAAPVAPPSQTPMQPMPQFQVSTQLAPTTSQAQSAVVNSVCPECRGTNYYSDPYNPSIPKRCFDCGFPVQQSGSRYGVLTGAHVEGAAKPATGNSTSSGFNPIPDGYSANGQKLG